MSADQSHARTGVNGRELPFDTPESLSVERPLYFGSCRAIHALRPLLPMALRAVRAAIRQLPVVQPNNGAKGS